MATDSTRGASGNGTAQLALLTVRQAADMLTVSTRKVYNLVTEGKLPHYRIDNVIRIAQDDVEDYIADCRVARQPIVLEKVVEPTRRARKPSSGQSAVKTSHLKIGPRQLSLLRRAGVGISEPSDRSDD